MIEQPLVSVIIPCFNAEKFVEMAIRSIMNQTYKNLEILIVDDCSTDSTYEILDRLAKSDKRIVLEKNEQNLKIVTTLNKLVLKAKGKYIARMDADDISAPDRIEKQVEFMDNNYEYGICGTNAYIINSKNKIIEESLLPNTNTDIQKAINVHSVFFHPSIMIRADLYKKNLYDNKFLYAEDFELWQRLLKITKGENIDQRLFFYRIVNSSASNNTKTSSIQKKITNELCKYNDFELLKSLKNKMFAGLVIWFEISNNHELKKDFKFWMILYIIRYFIWKIKQKIKYMLKNNYVTI